MADEQIKPSPFVPGPVGASASPIAAGAPPAAAHAVTADRPAPLPPTKKKPAQEEKDGTREVVETIVFVVVLVLLLKTFLAEAFVIPTGSMANTLLGYHKDMKCDQCKRPFLLNVSNWVEPEGQAQDDGGYCPNCERYQKFDVPNRENRR